MSLKMEFIAPALMLCASIANAQTQFSEKKVAQPLNAAENCAVVSANLQITNSRPLSKEDIAFTLAAEATQSRENPDQTAKASALRIIEEGIIMSLALEDLKATNANAYGKKILELQRAFENCKVIYQPYVTLAESLMKREKDADVVERIRQNQLLLKIPAAPSPAGRK